MTKKIIELEEETEGKLVEANDYIFDKIGEAVPIKTHDSSFDPQGSPSRPLAVSEKHGLVFVAHSSGFFVARTKDVMASATEIKEKGSSSSIQELSVVDVPLAKLHILALSTDSYTLAATADANIHFFSVGSLLDKGLEPSYSCSLDESGSVKDMQWTKKSENMYVVLSNLGKLYHGTMGGPLKDLMDNVDAVEWSSKGKLIAVARKDTLNILSSNFIERSSMLLSFKSWIGDPDTDCIIKVDSIRWVRDDSIILGCFQLTADGNEENYLVQVIQIKDGKFTNDSCKPVVVSFYDLFSCLIDDILPSASGPYLLLCYLEECELAITANRRNADQHVVYLSWLLGEESNEAVIVDILRDNLKPRIELQENGDDNLIMGLCIDKISICQKVSVRLGMEQRELSPYCILICLTLDGKLIMYHVASVSDITVKPASVSSVSDEEEDSTALVPVGCEPAKLSPQLGKEQFEKVAMDSPLGDKNKELDRNVSLDVLAKDDQKSLNVNETLMSTLVANQMLKKENTNSNKKVEPSTSSQSFKAQQELNFPNPYSNKNGKQVQLPVQENRDIQQASTDAFSQDEHSHVFRDLSMTGTQKNAVLATSSASFVETGVKSPGKMESAGLQSVSSQSWSSGKIITSKGADLKSPTVPSTFIQGSRSGTSTMVNFSGMPVENWGWRQSAAAGNIASVPPISSFQMSSQENFSIGKSFNHKIHPLKENYSELPQSRMPNSEPNLSKQFGNITEMTKELDMFLQSIEEPGGFRDACIVNQKSSIEELEREVGILSEGCRTWKSTMDERLHEVQHLFDMTVQVLARKIYMEGIVKQASDNRYWDFWSCQKLSSELGLKRRHILKMNQDLTDQLIQLERHFNGLELNKFGENDGAHAGRSTLQSRFGPSRHVQSLHSLHSTMTSQLAAADQLSDCLSKQMVALKIESPSIKQKNVKIELFETIGIPYDASFSSPSPDVSEFRGTPKEKLSFSLGSSAAKDQARRNVSASKNYEPETARRRRDSLDRSWANYEPTKATVKRLLLQESGKVSVNRSSLLIDKERFNSRLLEGSAITRPWDYTVPATFLRPENKDIQDTHSKQASESPATPFVLPKESARQNLMSESNMTADKSGEGIAFIKKSDSVSAKEKSVLPSDTSQKPSTFMVPTQTSSLLKKPNDMVNSYAKERACPTEDSVKDRPLNTTVAPIEAGKKHNSPFSPSFPVSVAPSATFSMSVSASSSSIFSSSSAPLLSLSSPSSASPTLSSVMSSNRSLASSNTMNKPVSTSPVSACLSPIVLPSGSFSLNVSKSPVPSDISPVTNSSSGSPKAEIQSSSKTDVNANAIVPVESGPSPAKTNLNLKPSILPPLTVETSTRLAPGNQSSLRNSSPAPAATSGSQTSLKNISGPTHNVTINAQQEQPSAGQSLFPIALSNSGSVTGRTNGLDVQNAQEDDMDEEAPDTSSAAGLSLGSLGAFGLGSSPNPTAVKPNPFGGTFGNVATNVTTSPFPMTVPSGELFQPASFNFQSLQPSPSSQTANSGAFASGFGTGTTAQTSSLTGFGQPAQVGPGQQALGSVLGAFGQSRQLGTGLPGTGFGSPSGFGGGVAGTKPPGGFSGAASTVGGFAAVASGGGGGFAALASGVGGFGGAASGVGGFGGAAPGVGGFGGAASGGSGFGGAASGGGGFGGAAPAGSGFAGGNVAGGGFGPFGGQQGSSGFSAFASVGGTGKAPDLFQMRK